MNKNLWVLCLLSLLFANRLQASDFYLMTVSSGDEFWSAYGHTALVVNGDVYGFGFFSFGQDNLIQSVIQNNMRYFVDTTALDRELASAKAEKRALTLTPLNLTEQQKSTIKDYLGWHMLPQNRQYRYHYFQQNCATKIRDLFNRVSDGRLEKQMAKNSGQSYFDLTFPVKNLSIMNLGLALGYGLPAYRERTHWELSAFPKYFHKQLQQPTVQAWLSGQDLPLTQVVNDSNNRQSWFKTHAALTILFIVWAVLFAISKTRNIVIVIWLSVQSLLGFGLLFLWFGTGHEIAAWNPNLLICFPLAFLAIKHRKMLYFTALSAVTWLIISLIFGFWYLFPLAIMNLMIYFNNRKKPQ